ncbi:MAG: hypothetical protein P4L90_02540 [Rhodopila sp.]|nr:hypothetical protein [Rhodopila sp.]
MIRSIDDGVRRDREASDLWLDAHRFQDMFAMRLACIKRERQAALAALAAAEACSEEARGAVAAARMAAEAVDRLIDERAASIEADAASKAQHALDDIARARQAASRRGKRDNGW